MVVPTPARLETNSNRNPKPLNIRRFKKAVLQNKLALVCNNVRGSDIINVPVTVAHPESTTYGNLVTGRNSYRMKLAI